MISYNDVKISVIMPVYNSEKYIEQAIDSILTQSFVNIEFIIIIEVGCNSKTVELVNSYKDKRIKIIYKKESEKGIATSLNKGIKAAVGEYIARMDADDISYPLRLAKQKKFLDCNKDVIMCGTGMARNGKINWYGYRDTNNIKFRSYFECPFAHPTVMWRRETFINANLYYKDVYSEDFELWKRVVEQFQVANLNDILLMYRVHEKSISAKCNNEMKKAVIEHNKLQIEKKGIEYTIEGEFLEEVSLEELEKREVIVKQLCALWDNPYLIHNALEDIMRVLYAVNNRLNFKRYWNNFSFVYTEHSWQKIRVYFFILAHRFGRPLRIFYLKIRRKISNDNN